MIGQRLFPFRITVLSLLLLLLYIHWHPQSTENTLMETINTGKNTAADRNSCTSSVGAVQRGQSSSLSWNIAAKNVRKCSCGERMVHSFWRTPVCISERRVWQQTGFPTVRGKYCLWNRYQHYQASHLPQSARNGAVLRCRRKTNRLWEKTCWGKNQITVFINHFLSILVCLEVKQVNICFSVSLSKKYIYIYIYIYILGLYCTDISSILSL